MLVQRWGVLRTAIPRGVSIKRTIALVNALVKLHNFCIDNSNPESTEEEVTMQQSTSADDFNIMNNRDGFVPLEREEHDGGGTFLVPRQLLDAGNHFEDIPRDRRRLTLMEQLPRKLLHDKVVHSHKVRPCTHVTY